MIMYDCGIQTASIGVIEGAFMNRTFRELSSNDLAEIREYALEELKRFLTDAGTPQGKYRRYENRLIAICLGQGAAQHFIDLQELSVFDNEVKLEQQKIQEKGYKIDSNGKVISGIKDIDVWFFFEQDDDLKIPDIRNCRNSIQKDFGNLGARSIDFLKKGLIRKDSPTETVRSYLKGNNRSGNAWWYLAQKSLVGLEPECLFEEILWATKRLQAV